MANIFKISDKNPKSKEKAVSFIRFTIDKFKHLMKHYAEPNDIKPNQLYCIFKENKDKNLYAIGSISYLDESQIKFKKIIVLYDYFSNEAEITYYTSENNWGLPFIENSPNLIIRKSNFVEESFINLFLKENKFNERIL